MKSSKNVIPYLTYGALASGLLDTPVVERRIVGKQRSKIKKKKCKIAKESKRRNRK